MMWFDEKEMAELFKADRRVILHNIVELWAEAERRAIPDHIPPEEVTIIDNEINLFRQQFHRTI